MEPPPGNVRDEFSLGPTCASPISRSVSDSEDSDWEDPNREDLDWDDDYAMWGQLADAEITVTRGSL